MSTAVPTAPVTGGRRGWKSLPLVRQLRQSVGLQRGMLVAGLVLSTLFVFVAIFAPLLAPYEYNQLRDPSGAFGAQQAPSSTHLLGTTVGGYDVLSRLLAGARTSLIIGVLVVLCAGTFGVLIGLWAGYKGGRADRCVKALRQRVAVKVKNAFHVKQTAPVAAPISWDELEDLKSGASFTRPSKRHCRTSRTCAALPMSERKKCSRRGRRDDTRPSGSMKRAVPACSYGTGGGKCVTTSASLA